MRWRVFLIAISYVFLNISSELLSFGYETWLNTVMSGISEKTFA